LKKNSLSSFGTEYSYPIDETITNDFADYLNLDNFTNNIPDFYNNNDIIPNIVDPRYRSMRFFLNGSENHKFNSYYFDGKNKKMINIDN
jgi:hypothetical protein